MQRLNYSLKPLVRLLLEGLSNVIQFFKTETHNLGVKFQLRLHANFKKLAQ